MQDILSKFEFRNQVPKLVRGDLLGLLIEKFLDRSINLSPQPVVDTDGKEIAVIDNGTVPDVSLSSPRGAAWLAGDERLYVTDAGSGRVFVFNVVADRL